MDRQKGPDWRWMIAMVQEVFRPRRLGGPRPERLAMLRRGEVPEEDGEIDAG